MILLYARVDRGFSLGLKIIYIIFVLITVSIRPAALSKKRSFENSGNFM